MLCTRHYHLLTGVLAATISLTGTASRADNVPAVATVAKTQGIVERRAAKSESWTVVPTGSHVDKGDTLTTGHLALAELRLTDTSNVCLGPQSAAEFTGGRSLRLPEGRLDYYAHTPVRIVAGAAAIEITGSIVLVSLHCDGSVDVGLDPGGVWVSTAKGTLQLEPGKAVTVTADGTIGPLRALTEKPLDEHMTDADNTP